MQSNHCHKYITYFAEFVGTTSNNGGIIESQFEGITCQTESVPLGDIRTTQADLEISVSFEDDCGTQTSYVMSLCVPKEDIRMAQADHNVGIGESA